MSEAVASNTKTGPLAGHRFIEMAGIGPVPLAGLMLAEMGADVLRVERAAAGMPLLSLPPEHDLDRHGRSVLRLDLKRCDALALMHKLCAGADALIEGFRPGVMERLGLGPEKLMAANPRLIYARMTGFGQDGPLAGHAGHDLTYLARTGILHAVGPRDGKPVPPLNLVADYGGGSMFVIAGLLAALLERSRSGRGQIVDAAMIDGASMLAAPYFAFRAAGIWNERRGDNLLDSGAPFYDTYETSDGKHVAVACLEPQFFAEFARLLPLEQRFVAAQFDRSSWPAMRQAIAGRFLTRTRGQWTELFDATDACVAPVLSFAEAPGDAHNAARGAHTQAGVLTRPSPAPRFSRTPSIVSEPAVTDPAQALAPFGIDPVETNRLVTDGVIAR